MIKFVHTADIHFGMENYGKIDPVLGIHTRLLDFERAFQYCIDYAIAERVDFFLFAGDAYKTAQPTPTHQRLLFNCFLKLYKAGIPVVMVIGNHDHPLSFGKANALEFFDQLPIDGFYVMSRPAILKLNTAHGVVQIVGIPWPCRTTIALQEKHLVSAGGELTKYISEAVGDLIHQFSQQLDVHIPAVLAGHLTVSSGIFSGSEKRAIYGTDPLFLPSQLAIHPFDYVALGHLHRYQNLHQGYPAVVYSGSVERIDFGERKEEKGFCLVTIHRKGETEHQFIPTPTRKFIQIDVHLRETGSQTEQIVQEIKKHVLENAVVKIVYHVPPNTIDKVDIAVIQNVCSSAHFLVGIFPVKPPVDGRNKRSALRVDMSFEELVSSYFDSKPEFKHQKEDLMKKIAKLEQEISTAS